MSLYLIPGLKKIQWHRTAQSTHCAVERSHITCEKNLMSAHKSVTQVLNPLLLNDKWTNIQHGYIFFGVIGTLLLWTTLRMSTVHPISYDPNMMFGFGRNNRICIWFPFQLYHALEICANWEWLWHMYPFCICHIWNHFHPWFILCKYSFKSQILSLV